MRSALRALAVTTWSSVGLAQGAPPQPPPPAAMTVPGTATTVAPPAAMPPPALPPAPPPAPPGSVWVLGPAPIPPTPPPGLPQSPSPPTSAGPVPAYPAPALVYARPAPTPRYDPYVRRPLVVEAHTSFGGPVGWLGVAVDYSLERHFSIMAGAGLGQTGPQLGAMARVRVPIDIASAGFGAGVSGGEYEDGFLSGSDRYRWDAAYWFNTEGFIEIRTKKGINIRPYLGSGVMLNRGAGKPVAPDTYCITDSNKATSCVELSPSRDRNPFLFYMGAAVGYAFEL